MKEKQKVEQYCLSDSARYLSVTRMRTEPKPLAQHQNWTRNQTSKSSTALPTTALEPRTFHYHTIRKKFMVGIARSLWPYPSDPYPSGPDPSGPDPSGPDPSGPSEVTRRLLRPPDWSIVPYPGWSHRRSHVRHLLPKESMLYRGVTTLLRFQAAQPPTTNWHNIRTLQDETALTICAPTFVSGHIAWLSNCLNLASLNCWKIMAY